MSFEQPVSTTTNNTTEQETHKVFIGNLSFSSTDESLKSYFKEAGEVLETIIIKRFSKPKGFGFVGFRTQQEAENAVKLFDKKELDGREMSVQLAIHKTAEELKASNELKKKKFQQRRRSSNNNSGKKSRKSVVNTSGEEDEDSNKENEAPVAKEQQQQQQQEEAVVTTTKPKTSIFVANLHPSIKKEDLADLFQAYEVESALVAIQRSGRSKGYGFVEFKSVEEMEKVLKEMVNIEVHGRPLHISAATSEKVVVVSAGGEAAQAQAAALKKKKLSNKKKYSSSSAAVDNAAATVPTEGTTTEEQGDEQQQQQKKKKSNIRNRRNKKTATKEKEGVNDTTKEAQEETDVVVDELKKEKEEVKEINKQEDDDVEAATVKKTAC